MRNFFYVLATAFLVTELFYNIVLAANEIQIQPGNIQISVGGILLDFTGSNSVLDQLAVSDSGDSITTTVSDSAYAQFISSDKRGFTVSPSSAYIKITCEATRSTVTIETPSSAPSTDFTITPLATTCANDSGGGGGGGGASGAGVGAAVSAITPIAAMTSPTLLLALISQAISPAEPTPRAQPASAPQMPTVEPSPTPPAEFAPPITVAATLEAAQAISAATSEITGALGDGISEIIRGISTGFSGEALIAENIPVAPSAIFDAVILGEYAWQTTGSLFPAAPNKPVFEIAERNTYEIVVYATANPSIKAVSGKFSLINKKPISFLHRRNISLGMTLFGENGADGQTINNRAALAAAANEDAPYIKITDPKPGDKINIGDIHTIRWEAKNLPGNGSVNIALAKGFDVAETARAIYTEIAGEVFKLRANPAVTRAIKQVAIPTSVTLTAVSAGTVTVTASVGSATFVFNLSQLLQYLAMLRFYALAFIRFKKRKPWGRVYDKLTANPLHGAKVQIYETQFNKLKDAQLTNAEGRFFVAVPPGAYSIKITRRGFDPQQMVVIVVDETGQLLNLEIALLPTLENTSLGHMANLNIINAIRHFIEAINPYLLLLGTAVSLTILTILPTTINYIGLAIYIILDISRAYLALHLIKPFGRVRDAQTGTPLSLAVVRIIDEEKNLLLTTRVTDAEGKFNFLVSPGRYRITAAKIGFAPFRSDILTFDQATLATTDVGLMAESKK